MSAHREYSMHLRRRDGRFVINTNIPFLREIPERGAEPYGYTPIGDGGYNLKL
jgi:hypothetical protein